MALDMFMSRETGLRSINMISPVTVAVWKDEKNEDGIWRKESFE
jgi:hypothetical protein